MTLAFAMLSAAVRAQAQPWRQRGLVDAGYWPDDSPEWVETLGSRFAKGAEQVVVEIIPTGELA